MGGPNRRRHLRSVGVRFGQFLLKLRERKFGREQVVEHRLRVRWERGRDRPARGPRAALGRQ